MNVAELWQIAALGAAGGIAAEVLHWYSLARQPAGAVRFSSGPIYWATTVAMVGLGALIPVLYIQGEANALLCFHLGAATPVLLQKLVTAPPPVVQTQGGAASLRDFFSW